MIGSIVALAAGAVIMSVALLPVQAGPAEGDRGMRPQPVRRTRPLVAQQRTEDRGFSLTLTSPDEAYLVGPLKVTVEPVVPPGDVLERADFFIDGKLVFTDRVPPYAFQNDFGSDILQHAIVVRARTLDGREARVAFVSRAADVSDSAAGPIEVVPAVVRDAAGRPVVDLTVSDFSLLENGESRPIVHFDNAPAPVSIVVALNDRDLDPADRAALLNGAAAAGDDLPHHHALGFAARAALAAAPAAQERPATVTFAHDRDDYREQFAAARNAAPAGRAPTLPQLLDAAAQSLLQRRGGRALLLLTGGPPPPPPVSEAPSAGDEVTAVVVTSAEMEEQKKKSADLERRLETLRAALQMLQRARVTVNVLLAGNADPDHAEIALLRSHAAESGGEFIVLQDGADTQIAFLRIAESLLNRYLISFQPRHPERGGDRVIEVRVRRPHLLVKAPTALSGE
jgi:VWFA-related protein